MSKELKKLDRKDMVFASINGIAEQVNILFKLYPRATKEIFLFNKVDIGKPYSSDKRKYKKEELREVAMAQLSVDIAKNKFKNDD